MTAMSSAVPARGRLRSLGASIGTLPFTILGLLAVIMIAIVLAVVVMISLQEKGSLATGAWTLGNYRAILGDSLAFKAAVNTFWFTIVVVATSMTLGVPVALLVERTTLPARGLVITLLTLTLAVPSFFPAMGWQFLLHPRIGIANQWLVKTFSLSGPPIDIGSVAGMGFVQGLSFVPLAFIMVAPAFRNMDPSLEESAQIHGARLWDRLLKITLPLMWPSILAAALYVLALAITAFDIPAFLGMGSRIYMLSTYLYVRTQPLDEPPDYGLVGAISVFAMILALFISWWYLRTIRHAERYQVISGKAYRPQRFDLGRWTFAAWLFIAVVIALSMVLPLLALIWASLLPFLMLPSHAALGMMTLANFQNISWSTYWFSLGNTVKLTFWVPSISIVLGVAISWSVIKTKSRLSSLFDVVSFLPHVIPHLIFAVGALFIGLYLLPPSVPFYGTISIIVLVNVIVRIPFATRMCNSSLLQINKELDEAGYVSGLHQLSVFWRIVRPLLAPTLLYAWLWMALLTYRELTMAALLVTKDNTMLPVYIWAIWTGGGLNQAAAVSLLSLVMVMPLVILYFTLGRRAALWAG